ncbi:hypothetical protein CYMTET_49331 [Cymbomonas tetramitiformis]|uniref:Polycystin cation channel PKD1/PKD2 domain-containing protein n=1 Tax=Cymbomonas tetramitiformis TaxID=36881 RepID=A0AAE0EVW5_9CHLO|nr:hypothetical protein CYMTET_49331 [Cymbomonas tetramitiformis]
MVDAIDGNDGSVNHSKIHSQLHRTVEGVDPPGIGGGVIPLSAARRQKWGSTAPATPPQVAVPPLERFQEIIDTNNIEPSPAPSVEHNGGPPTMHRYIDIINETEDTEDILAEQESNESSKANDDVELVSMNPLSRVHSAVSQKENSSNVHPEMNRLSIVRSEDAGEDTSQDVGQGEAADAVAKPAAPHLVTLVEDVRDLLYAKIERRRQSRELLLWCFFCVLLTTMFLMQVRVESAAHLEGSLRDFFHGQGNDFTEAVTASDVWAYFKNVAERQRTEALYFEEMTDAHILDNRVLSWALTQKRVIRRECSYVDSWERFRDIYPVCSNELGYGDDFTGDWYGQATEEEYLRDFPPAEFLDGDFGHYVPFNLSDVDSIVQRIELLEKYKWIDHSTREVRMWLSVFNGQLLMLGKAWMPFTVNQAGNFVPDPGWHMSSSRVFTYQTFTDYLRAVMELIMVGFLGYYGYHGVALWRSAMSQFWFENNTSGLHQLCTFWDFLDLGTLVAFGYSAWSWLMWGISNSDLEYDPKIIYTNSHHFEELMAVTTVFHNYTLWGTMNVLLCMMRIFKFFEFNSRLSILTRTVWKAMPEIVNFLIMFMIIYFSFALYAYVVYGRHGLYNFRTYAVSCDTMFRMMLGEYDIADLFPASHVMPSRVFFYVYTILAGFVMLNIMLAIVIETYSDVWKEQEDSNSKPIYISAYRGVRRLYNTKCRRLFRSVFPKKKRDESAADMLEAGALPKTRDPQARKMSTTQQLALVLKQLENEKHGNARIGSRTRRRRQ